MQEPLHESSLSFIHSALGDKYITHTKPGWLNAAYVARNDAGIVMSSNRPYLLVILSSAYGRDASLINLVNALDAVHSDMTT